MHTPPSPKLVFAHFMLCFGAFAPPGNSSESIEGYQAEMAVAQANGLDGFGAEYLGRDAYYAPAAAGMFEACGRYNAAHPDRPPFQLFIIINFCCGLNLTDAVALYTSYHNHSCAQRLDGRPVFSSWSAIDWRAGGANESARWERDFFAPIAAAGLPRPFFLPFIYAYNNATGVYEETATLEEQRRTLALFTALDGLWYWGCAPPGDAVAASSAATVQACREAGKVSAVPFSAPYSPHIGHRGVGGNNRYTQGNGGQGLEVTWLGHIQAQPDLVIATTWNDLGEHHYLGPYNKTLWGHDTATGWQAPSGPNLFPHTPFLELSAHFIAWYKLPPGSPEPLPRVGGGGEEALFYFYNLQPFNNTCPGDPVGPPALLANDPAFPLEDAVYVTALLGGNATLHVTSGGGGTPVTFHLPPGRSHVQVPAAPGTQRFQLVRGGAVLVDVVGSEAVNSTEQASGICNAQTFSGSQHF